MSAQAVAETLGNVDNGKLNWIELKSEAKAQEQHNATPPSLNTSGQFVFQNVTLRLLTLNNQIFMEVSSIPYLFIVGQQLRR